MNESIIGRGLKAGAFEAEYVNIRDFAGNKHNRVDDSPYGGGRGLVMQAEPIFAAVSFATKELTNYKLLCLSPTGRTFTEQTAKELSTEDNIIFICGHYEGIDRRLLDELQPTEISLGDFVVTGGELPSLVIADAVARLLPGVLPEEAAFTEESHWDGLLEYPHYTRPEVWRGRKVPDVLLSGHHENIRKWRQEQSERITHSLRPDMLL